ncbi:MAG: cupin domain-containing protein [Proteobacteria bacterium]|nr:cupin domain-containing protein [Pseudomonadota bacterium]
MKINADLSKRAEVHTPDMEWQPSPEPGVLRRMLDRDGEEVARCTTVVRFEPGARFPEHTHGGGEEFLVLDGVFNDEDGDYPAGTYVRHPVGTSHSAWSEEGCEILVKLMQMDPADQKKVVLDTDALDWQPGTESGVDIKPLHEFGDETVMLMRILAGTRIPRHRHEIGTELFVLEGTLTDESGSYPKGTWLRQPTGSVHEPFSEQGCVYYVKKGHFV